MGQRAAEFLKRVWWKMALPAALVLAVLAICLHCRHISGMVYSTSLDRSVGQASLWIWNWSFSSDKGHGIYLISMEIPDQSIVLRGELTKQSWSVYESDRGITWAVPVHYFLDGRYEVNYVSVFPEKNLCTMATEDDLLVWPMEE